MRLLLRRLQAIQNVIRHAGNAQSTVDSTFDRDLLTFTVRDEGPGFDADARPGGMGTRIMHDRIDALEGALTVESAVGQGTTVAGRIPPPRWRERHDPWENARRSKGAGRRHARDREPSDHRGLRMTARTATWVSRSLVAIGVCAFKRRGSSPLVLPPTPSRRPS